MDRTFNRAYRTFFRENVIHAVYNGLSVIMPKKTVTNDTSAAPASVTKPRVAKPAAANAAPSRVKSVKHSKSAVPAAMEIVEVAAITAVNPHEQIAKIAYGYWEARGYESGFHEQDWLRAEQEFLLSQ